MNQTAEKIEESEVIQIDDQIMVKEFNIKEITKSNLDLMEKQILEIPAEPTTPKQYNSSKDKHIALKKLLPQIEERRKELKAPVLEKGKNIDKTAKKAASMVQPLIELAGSRRFAWEDVKADEKAAKDKIEQARIHKISSLMEDLTTIIATGVQYNLEADKIFLVLESLNKYPISAVDFQEKTEEAEQLLEKGLSDVATAYDNRTKFEEGQAETARVKKKQEAEAKRLADEKAKFEEVKKAAQEEKDRIDTIEIEIKQLGKLCFFLPGIATGVLKAHKENLANMKPSKRIFQEKYSDACSIVEDAFGKSFIAWEAAVKQDEIKEKLEAGHKALEAEKAEIKASEEASALKEYSAMWDEATRMNWAIVNDSATLENEYFDRDKAQDEEDRKEKLQQDKERSALVGPDKMLITTIATDLDKMISEYEIPVLNTAEGNSLVVALIAGLKTEIHTFETAGGLLV